MVPDTVVFVLGTNWSGADRGKLQALKNLQYVVYSVNRSPCGDASLAQWHIECDFKQLNRAIGKFDPIIFSARESQKEVIVVLDHAWLAPGYYHDQYGTKWLSDNVPLFIQRGVSQIFLPKDEAGKGMKSAMDEM